ncbi:MAG: PsbP-related protein [Methanoregula sp.]
MKYLLFVLVLVAVFMTAGCTSLPPSDKSVSPATTVPTSAIPATSSSTIAATPIPVIITTSAVTPVPTTGTSFNQYSNSKYGFSIDYPRDWQKNDLDKQETNISLTRYNVVEFYSPSFIRCNTEKNDCVNVRAEVKVEVDTQPAYKDLDTFFIKDVARITSGSGVEITKRDAMFKLMGDKAYRLDYLSKPSTGEVNTLSAYTIKDGKAYIITYHAHSPERNETNNQFEQYYNDVMSMFSSFNANMGNIKTI